MDKTVVVIVEDRVAHKRYKKIIGRTYRLKAHDEENACGVGDQLCDGLIHTGGGGRDVRTDIGNARDLEQALNRAVLAVFAVHHGEDHVDALTHNAVVFKA